VAVVASFIAVKTLLLGARVLIFNLLPLPRRYRDAVERSLRFNPRDPQRQRATTL
jgi:hypothetical protein